MNSKSDQGLDQFLFRFLENRGALLERYEGGFEALLPEALSDLLKVPEHIRIGDGADSGLNGQAFAGYGSPFLDRILEIVCGNIPLVSCRLEVDYLKSRGFDRLIGEQFRFYKFTGRIEATGTTNVHYLLLQCHYVAQSDEQKEGLVRLVLNCETGAYIPGMVEILSDPKRDFQLLPKQLGDDLRWENALAHTKVHLEEALREEIYPFRESMRRRFRRDAANLEEYYHSLKREMEKSLEKPGLSEDLIRDRKEKTALLPEELARKRDDLFQKYSIAVRVVPSAARLIRIPVVKIIYRLSAGKSQKTLSLIYNPVTHSLDPIVCQGCGKNIRDIYFCPHLHVLCSSCHKKCPLGNGE